MMASRSLPRPNVQRIALPTSLPVGDINIYYVPGRIGTLIDAGPNSPAALAAVLDGLAAAGARGDEIHQILVTHTHLDHCGLAASLHGATGARVYAHPAAVTVLRAFDQAWDRRFALIQGATLAANVDPIVRQRFLELYVERKSLGASVPEPALVALGHGAQLTIADRRWRIYHTPGHAPDHVCAHDRRSGSLFCGDLLLRYLNTVPVLSPRSSRESDTPVLDQLASSWRRIGRLPVAIAWPGHGAPIRAHRILVARRLVTTRQRLRAARDAVATGAETLWEIALAIGLPDTPELLDMTLGETGAMLEWLVRRGRVSRRRDGVVVRYAPAQAPRPKT